jgi:hypothetical protein
MAEEARPDYAAEETTAEQSSEGQKPVRLLARLLTPRWLLTLLALSMLGHGIGLTCAWLRAPRPAHELSPEVSLGVFRFTPDPAESGEITRAEFHLHIALLRQVEAAARRQLQTKRLRVQEAVEELIRRAHGGDFDDPRLAGLKQQLQEQINESLGLRVIDEVIITDLHVERKEGQRERITETAERLPWTESPPGLGRSDAERQVSRLRARRGSPPTQPTDS